MNIARTAAAVAASALVITFGVGANAATTQQKETHQSTDRNGGAQGLVNGAVSVVKQMEKDPKLVSLMQKAKGVYIVPDFGRAAAVVGGSGGAGLVLVHQGDKWSDPAFYDFGGVSIGAQVGGSGGSLVFLLMNQTAVDAFKSGNKFSLNAGAGLTIVNYAAAAQGSLGKGDIILWSDTKGAYAGARISLNDVGWDFSNNKSYYGPHADLTKVLDGTVKNAGAANLQSALAAAA